MYSENNDNASSVSFAELNIDVLTVIKYHTREYAPLLRMVCKNTSKLSADIPIYPSQISTTPSLIEFIREEGGEIQIENILSRAIARRDLEKLRLMISVCKLTQKQVDDLTLAGSAEIIEYALKFGYTYTDAAISGVLANQDHNLFLATRIDISAIKISRGIFVEALQTWVGTATGPEIIRLCRDITILYKSRREPAPNAWRAGII